MHLQPLLKDQAWTSCEHPVFLFFERVAAGAGGGAAYIDKDKIENSQTREARHLDCQGKGAVVKLGSVTDRLISTCTEVVHDLFKDH
jgi:hypothetical protein